MDIHILLLTLLVTAVSGAPHEAGSETPTHAPNIAPDSESIIVAGTHGETHHSDVYLTKTKNGNSAASEAVDSGEIHHGDTHMMKGNKKTGEAQVAESTTHLPEATTVVIPAQGNEKPRGWNENSGAHPVAPVHHANHNRKNGDGITKSIVAHSPVASFVEGSKSDKSERNLPSSGNEAGSIVSHGPMIKHADNHEKKFDSSNKNEAVHSTVQHAPMATEHHPPKPVAQHPSLSKNVPISSGHAPMVNHPVVEDKAITEEPRIVEVTTVKDAVDEIHPLPHAPTADDSGSKPVQAHHPSLSKIDAAQSVIAHAPLAIPTDNREIHVEKRSEMSEVGAKDSTTPRIIEVHHPLLSKTEAALPIASKAIQDDQKGDDVSTTLPADSHGTHHLDLETTSRP